MGKFKIGDKVIGYITELHKYQTGEVVCILDNGTCVKIGVKLSEYNDILGDLLGQCKKGYGKWFNEFELEYLPEEIMIGDKVQIIDNTEKAYGEIGTVVAIESPYNEIIHYSYGVKFDTDIGGHSLEGLCDYGYGWWYPVGVNTLKKVEKLQFKIGDKVVPKTKLGNSLFGYVYKDMQSHDLDFLYITDIFNEDDKTIYQLDIKMCESGDFYYEEDLELYIPEKEVIEDKLMIQPFDTEIVIEGVKTKVRIKYNGKTFVGTSKCCPTDVFNKKIGVEIATCRAIEKINKYKLNQLID